VKNDAFSILELVFLAAVSIPHFERDNAAEAAYQIARHIRLAQHYALVEDKFSATDSDWWKAMWAVTFRTSKKCYAVYSNQDYNMTPPGTQADEDECAIDPLTGKRLYSDTNCRESTATTDHVLLWKSFGVDNITLTDCGSNNQILFDHVGRPYGSAGIPLEENCVITIETEDDHSASVTVNKETGFVKITSVDGVDIP